MLWVRGFSLVLIYSVVFVVVVGVVAQLFECAIRSDRKRGIEVNSGCGYDSASDSERGLGSVGDTICSLQQQHQRQHANQ